MYVLGLTGSIAMGKSTVLEMFQDSGVPTFDTDQEVRVLYATNGHIQSAIKRSFPGAFVNGAINRAKLANLALSNKENLDLLESIVHPVLMLRMGRFLEKHKKEEVPLIVYDIPILFEVGAGDSCDGVIVVSAPEEVQKERALARPGMTEARLTLILGRQMLDQEKRDRADFIINTGTSLEETRDEVDALVKQLNKSG
jgi:dephospho-CoA kinase